MTNTGHKESNTLPLETVKAIEHLQVTSTHMIKLLTLAFMRKHVPLTSQPTNEPSGYGSSSDYQARAKVLSKIMNTALVNEEDAQQEGQLREKVSAHRFQRSHYILIANQRINRPYLVLHTKTESVLTALDRIPEQGALFHHFV
ncbi:hypothetical protein T07_4171 [Trichinella nelsoni]|uniref:Uncharacterized protein n=1 Tax=Trichinella nelsoni TaxID=6336 RepID=A0A0V0S3U3_9BILA|nr:hypothetical protein T07_4171 [Trichinella nelsoni]